MQVHVNQKHNAYPSLVLSLMKALDWRGRIFLLIWRLFTSFLFFISDLGCKSRCRRNLYKLNYIDHGPVLLWLLWFCFIVLFLAGVQVNHKTPTWKEEYVLLFYFSLTCYRQILLSWLVMMVKLYPFVHLFKL